MNRVLKPPFQYLGALSGPRILPVPNNSRECRSTSARTCDSKSDDSCNFHDLSSEAYLKKNRFSFFFFHHGLALACLALTRSYISFSASDGNLLGIIAGYRFKYG